MIDPTNPQITPRKKTISITHIRNAVSGLPEETDLCVMFLPKGIPVQLHYEDFALARGFTMDATCQEITHILEAIPQNLENDYLWSATRGDFDLCGQLWISPAALYDINRRRNRVGFQSYHSIEDAIQSLLRHNKQSYAVKSALFFTPTWSHQLLGDSAFATYDNFLSVLDCNFIIEDRQRLTVGTINTLNAIYEEKSGYNDARSTLAFDEPKLEGLVVYKNDLVNSRFEKAWIAGDGRDDVILAGVRFEPESMEAVLSVVSIEPDRFGRLRPVIGFEDRIHRTDTLFWTSLPTIEDLQQHGYDQGDVVDVTYTAEIPRLGKILRKSTDTDRSPWNQTLHCESCTGRLVERHGQRYCGNEWCQSTTLYRILYACTPTVLDLPIDRDDAEWLCLSVGFPLTLPTLLTLGREEFNEIVSNTDVDLILRALCARRNQLHGIGYPSDVQSLAQTRFLDALSLNGLHRTNSRRLQKGLSAQDWLWTDLEQVLTHHPTLRGFGISRRDAQEIVDHTNRRREEIQAYAEL
jgi:NAD-dependent DNA ligase